MPGGQLVLGMHERLPETAIDFRADDAHLPFYQRIGQTWNKSSPAIDSLQSKMMV